LVESQYKWNIVSADIFLLPNSSFYKEYSQIHSAPTTCRGIQFCIDDDWEIIKVILQESPEEAQGKNHYPVLLIFREAKESVREITVSHFYDFGNLLPILHQGLGTAGGCTKTFMQVCQIKHSGQ